MDLEKIYREYFTIVYRYTLSISRDSNLAEEITQETFVKALQKIGGFRGDCDINVWLCQIAKNEYLQHLKKQNKRGLLGQELAKTSAVEVDESPEQDFVKKEMQLKIQKILHDMEEPYKEVFYMRTYGEMSFKDIGMIFKRQETWARVTYYRARKKIMEVMENEDNL